MKVNLTIEKGNRIRAFYLFFIIYNIQLAVGIMGTPRYIIEHSRQDAWVSVIISYIGVLIVTATMFLILSRYKNADIFGIQKDIFGNFIGKVFGAIYLLFFFFQLLSVLVTYTEIIQIFIFPTIKSFVVVSLLLILVVYTVLGGIRVITGVVFIFSFISALIVPFFYDAISRLDIAHFFPVFDASMIELLKGAKATSYTLFGMEIVFLIYPFVDNKHKVKLPVYLGVSYTSFIIMLSTITSIGYFSLEGMEHVPWPVITLFKSIEFSFIERYDYIVIVEWMMLILTTLILLKWAIIHGTERIFRIKPKITVYVVFVILLIVASNITVDRHIQKLTDAVSQIGFWIVFVYPLILLPLVLLKTRQKRSKDVRRESHS